MQRWYDWYGHVLKEGVQNDSNKFFNDRWGTSERRSTRGIKKWKVKRAEEEWGWGLVVEGKRKRKMRGERSIDSKS